jgi:hypothetical protein
VTSARAIVSFNDCIDCQDIDGLERLMAEDHALHRLGGRQVGGQADVDRCLA